MKGKSVHVTGGRGKWFVHAYSGNRVVGRKTFSMKNAAVSHADAYSRKVGATRYGNAAYGEYGTRQGTVARAPRRKIKSKRSSSPFGFGGISMPRITRPRSPFRF